MGRVENRNSGTAQGSTASQPKLQSNLTPAQVNSAHHCRVFAPTVLWAEPLKAAEYKMRTCLMPSKEKQLHGHFHPHSDRMSNLLLKATFSCPTCDLIVYTSHITADMEGFKIISPFSFKTGCFTWGQGYLCWPKLPSIFSTDYRAVMINLQQVNDKSGSTSKLCTVLIAQSVGCKKTQL